MNKTVNVNGLILNNTQQIDFSVEVEYAYDNLDNPEVQDIDMSTFNLTDLEVECTVKCDNVVRHCSPFLYTAVEQLIISLFLNDQDLDTEYKVIKDQIETAIYEQFDQVSV